MKDLTKYIHSRAAAIILMVVAVCAAAISLYYTDTPAVIPENLVPIVFISPGRWLTPSMMSFAINIAANIAIAALLLVINRTYRMVQSMTWIFVGLFFFMQLAYPGALGYFNCGTFIALTVMSLTTLLFSTYTCITLTRSTYLLFFLLATASLFQINIMLFLPVFILGTVQMKVFDVRNILAILMGTITPVWILAGFGVISLSSFKTPFAVDSLSLIQSDHSVYLAGFISKTFTVGLAVIFTLVNFIKVMSYNSARRAFNGFFSLLLFAVIILVIIDHYNSASYVALLNILTAYQVGHFFAIRRMRLSYVPVCIIFFIYAALATLPIVI